VERIYQGVGQLFEAERLLGVVRYHLVRGQSRGGLLGTVRGSFQSIDVDLVALMERNPPPVLTLHFGETGCWECWLSRYEHPGHVDAVSRGRFQADDEPRA
jgi:hypothetical protein